MKSVTDKMSHGFRIKSPNICTKQFLNLSLLTIFKFYWPFFSGKRTVDYLPEMYTERSWNCSGPFLLMSSCIISYIRRADSLVKRELTFYVICCSHVFREIALILSFFYSFFILAFDFCRFFGFRLWFWTCFIFQHLSQWSGCNWVFIQRYILQISFYSVCFSLG